jgi:hypothetical protein
VSWISQKWRNKRGACFSVFCVARNVEYFNLVAKKNAGIENKLIVTIPTFRNKNLKNMAIKFRD